VQFDAHKINTGIGNHNICLRIKPLFRRGHVRESRAGAQVGRKAFPGGVGNWNLEPRGPHMTPSFYFGFTNDLLPIIVPWLQLNSLGLTILPHPNTDDPRADHLYYTLWVNRSQPVTAYNMPRRASVEKLFPNTRPTV